MLRSDMLTGCHCSTVDMIVSQSHDIARSSTLSTSYYTYCEKIILKQTAEPFADQYLIKQLTQAVNVIRKQLGKIKASK